MNIKIKLIGRYQNIVGKKELTIKIKNGDTIWYVIDAFVKKYPEIEKDKKFLMVSKNNVFSNYETKIKEGDEITISPPVVSGG
jgi:MoaD family protein